MRILLTTDCGGRRCGSTASPLARGLVERHGLPDHDGVPSENRAGEISTRQSIKGGRVELVSLPVKLEWMA